MASLREGQLAALMLNQDFGGLTIDGREISREALGDLAKLDAEQARHKRELERLDRQLSDLDPRATTRRLTLSNLRRLAKDKHSEAAAKAMVECIALGIPIDLAMTKPSLDKKLDALFARSYGGKQ